MKKQYVIYLLFILIGLSSCETFSKKGTLEYKVIRPNETYTPLDGRLEYLDVFKVSVTYKNAKGESITKENIDLPWSYTEEIKAPFTASLRVMITLRDPNKEFNHFPIPNALRLGDIVITSGNETLSNAGSATGTGYRIFNEVQTWLANYGNETFILVFEE